MKTSFHPSLAVGMYSGPFSIRTKSGVTPILYEDFIEWAKKQGRSSPFRRLYTPLPSPRKKRKSAKSRCSQQGLKAGCCCRVVVTDSFSQTEKSVFPSEREVRLWKESEPQRKGRSRKANAASRPPCPMSCGLCPLYRPFKDMDALRERMQMVLRGGEKWLMEIPKVKAAKQLLKKHCMDLRYDPKYAEVEIDPNLLLTLNGLDDLETQVQSKQPDEPYEHYTPEAFLDFFGFKMESVESFGTD